MGWAKIAWTYGFYFLKNYDKLIEEIKEENNTNFYY